MLFTSAADERLSAGNRAQSAVHLDVLIFACGDGHVAFYIVSFQNRGHWSKASSVLGQPTDFRTRLQTVLRHRLVRSHSLVKHPDCVGVRGGEGTQDPDTESGPGLYPDGPVGHWLLIPVIQPQYKLQPPRLKVPHDAGPQSVC